jgi:hypothetical protein
MRPSILDAGKKQAGNKKTRRPEKNLRAVKSKNKASSVENKFRPKKRYKANY